MELLQELFVTAIVAVLFSFIIAKLVSIAMAGGDSNRDSQLSKSQIINQNESISGNVDDSIVEDLQHFESLKVQGIKSEKRVELVEEVFQQVDEFVEPVEVEKVGKLVNRDEAIETDCRELPPESTEEGLKKEEELSEDRLGKSVAEIKLSREVGDDKNAIEQSDNVIEGRCFNDIENREIEPIGVEFSVEKDVVEESEEIRVVKSRGTEKAEVKKIEIDSDEDDWEGIERSELEQVFAKAVKFVEHRDKDGGLTSAGNDVQMELYGLHKIATEGPCREQPPMALKVTARAKWVLILRRRWSDGLPLLEEDD
ncbi:acyl-CoA-binding domain-containing protein 3 isoform X3 [Manihot esculenta]|uniref:acyl-CoA-binding domain-containing protein 3 isoform X3 n=1 Tax=Manihot esculenta TaxID=3983 RepID=UPI001CC45E2B|nr:acyl-CoA-binding domain-containing protein 3 isoform X3 [Manihot esculenta]